MTGNHLHILYDDLAAQTGPLEKRHAQRLHCKKGCSRCCVDDLTVFEIEARHISDKYGELLTQGQPHPEGQCAFLDENGACRIYIDRPYVCRTQGLPLRWLDEDAEVEMRDICPLNAEGPAIEELAVEECWTLGPFESRLADLQSQRGTMRRVPLRSLFSKKTSGAWILERMDDHGIEYEVGRFAEESDAEMEKELLESKNHKQTYRVRREGGA